MDGFTGAKYLMSQMPIHILAYYILIKIAHTNIAHTFIVYIVSDLSTSTIFTVYDTVAKPFYIGDSSLFKSI